MTRAPNMRSGHLARRELGHEDHRAQARPAAAPASEEAALPVEAQATIARGGGGPRHDRLARSLNERWDCALRP
jgi:hypothetical protein